MKDKSHSHCHNHTHELANHKHKHHSHDKHHFNHHSRHDHGIGHHHSHDHGIGHHHGPANGNKTGLLIALIITSSIMLLEFVGGLITNSLALLADSGHMLSDAFSLLLSFIAITLSAKAATPKRSFGNHRFEILAALFNGATLFVIAIVICIEAFERFQSPSSVASASMMLIAAIGLTANLLSIWFLMRKGDVEGNINLRSAYLHVIGDALGSIGAIVAGAIMLIFDWYYADPLISILVALLILRGAWRVLKQTIHILMEGTPEHIKLEDVKKALLALEHVTDIHNLHIWTITSGMHALTCHLVVYEESMHQVVLKNALQLIEEQFNLTEVTIQIETSEQIHPHC